jgi:4-hydroxybenzoate polyprenyltransferase
MLTGEVKQLDRAPAVQVSFGTSARALLTALRPIQWTKNGLVFIALAFTLNLLDATLLLRSTAAFVCFCAASSAGYLLNDISDVASDRRHPIKRQRPIASGAVSVPVAVATMLILCVGSVAGGFAISIPFGVLVISYLALTTTYTRWLKQLLLIDVFGIAAGFVMRAAAGGIAISVPISPWLYLATLLGALLIALGKRRAELQMLGMEAAGHRRSLDAYSVEFIDQLILLISSSTLMTYALYTFSADNLPRSHSMMLTIPVVLYGIFRYLFLVRGGGSSGRDTGAPEELLIRDRPLLLTVVVWCLLSVAILYVGNRI